MASFNWTTRYNTFVKRLKWATFAERLTEGNACHGSGQSKLQLHELGSERHGPVDDNGVGSAVEDDQHQRTVSGQTLKSLRNSGETACSQIQRQLVSRSGTRR